MRKMLLWILLIVVPAGFPTARAPDGQGQPNGSLVSPEVHADRRVTFRIYAPNATAVSLRGPLTGTTGPVKLERGAQGVWSATVGPLAPDLYAYSFIVDGVRTLDPTNPTIRPGVNNTDNMVFVAGEGAEFLENRPVPHGDLRQVWYRSSTLRMQRRMHVYTPPGYDSGKSRYPVLYLLHGRGEDDSQWSTQGRAGFIIDNLIAEKNAKAMVVVMPNNGLPLPDLPADAPNYWSAFHEPFNNELMKEIIPHVERSFRVLPGHANRALAGLSLGGVQSLWIAARHPDQFAYVGVWGAGAGFNPQHIAEFQKQNADFLDDAPKMNRMFKLFSISVGREDVGPVDRAKDLSSLLSQRGITNQLHVSSGRHDWINWRRYFKDFVQALFRD